MERLTRPTVEVDETAAKYMGTFPVDLRKYGDRLMEVILNGPTLNGVNKDALRQIIRQLYGALKAYEDIGLEPQEIEQTLMNFSSFLMEMTGGRMSKTNYTVQAMVSEANDHFESICDECRERAADVAPVVHGRWEQWWPGISLIMTGEEMLYRCSVCDAKYADVEGHVFCPNCGARMDGAADKNVGHTIPVNDLYDEDGGEV